MQTIDSVGAGVRGWVRLSRPCAGLAVPRRQRRHRLPCCLWGHAHHLHGRDDGWRHRDGHLPVVPRGRRGRGSRGNSGHGAHLPPVDLWADVRRVDARNGAPRLRHSISGVRARLHLFAVYTKRVHWTRVRHGLQHATPKCSIT